MQKIIPIYQESVKENLRDIKSILERLGMLSPELAKTYEQILMMTSQNITGKWEAGRKYARTYFSRKAFAEHYPEEYLKLSLYIDAMVNILDDIYDENMNKETRGLYLVEFLRIFSLYNLSELTKNIQEPLGHYFNQLITLAVAEGVYFKMIEGEKELDKIVKLSADLLLCRAQDIDIFNEIALVNYQNNKKENIKLIGRIFRAINILKKDVNDIDYDKSNNMVSVVTHISDRQDINFSEYLKKLANYLLEKAEKEKSLIKDSDSKIKTPVNNFMAMIKENVSEIENLGQIWYSLTVPISNYCSQVNKT